MIPVKLSMRNFMCYRDNVPTLNFDGIHLACLSGDNGNGKSALIDAMTWALWGQTRAKSDDELVHSGQTEMEVEFDFRVGQQLYRIIRKHSRPKGRSRSGQTMLEFQIATGNGFKPVSAEGVVQTQHKITDVLHMDYDTFVNSAYLRQGHADEFTRQPPLKRKEVLANILGFTFYDELEEQAKALGKQQEAEKAQLEGNIKDLGDELALKPVYEAELVQAQGALSSIEATVKQKETELSGQRLRKETLEKKRVQLEQLEAHMRETARELGLWDEQVSQHRSRVKEFETLIAQRSSIEDGYARFTEARRLGDELDQKFRKMASLNEHKHHLEMTIAKAGQEVVKAHALSQSKINELQARSQSLPALKDKLKQVQVQLRQLTGHEDALRQKQQASQELQAQVNYLESNIARLEREIGEIGEKLSLLSHTEARCPLCETELGAEGLKLIASKYNAEEQSKSESLKSTRAELALKKTEFETIRKETSMLESWLNQEKAAAQGRTGIIQKEITEAEEAEKQLAREREGLAEIEQRLAGRDFAATEQAALAQLEGELAGLKYDSEQHERVRHQLKELEEYDRSKRGLDEADRLVSQEKDAEARADAAAEKLRLGLEADKQTGQTLTTELVLFPQVLNSLAQAENELKELTGQRNQAQETMGSVKARLERCAELEKRKAEKEGQLSEASKQEGIYKQLAEAFGKGGIQALLIDASLPEIEAEANRLLGRMTDNRMHVKFETQRETRKGSVVETLDINIADELGTRNYEMFSGGEAFRINFAIRIALSRLLARRAGAPLPTLIIDEGFGTQDVTGIEKLKEAINSIQDDFDKIIVVTHMEELKDAFPTRIDVVKTPEGSTLAIS